MKAYAFRIFVVIPLLASLLFNAYQPAQAAAAAASANAVASAGARYDLSARPASSPMVAPSAAPPLAAPQPAPLASLPNAPVLVSPADGASMVTAPVRLTVTASDPDGGSLKVSFYGRRKTSAAAPNFTIAVIPDTQNYVESSAGEATFKAITQYIADSQTQRNTVFVTHTGDISNNGDLDTDASEWIIADAAMDILDRSTTTYADDVPYSVMPGNHDDDGSEGSYLINYNAYFGVARFSGRPYYGGHYGSDNLANYSTFSVSGMHFILINLPCFSGYPTAAIMNWADSLLKDDLSRRGIVACHSMMDNATNLSWIGSYVVDGLKDNPNLLMIIGGHAGVGRHDDIATDGHTIYTVMSDYSGYTGGGDGLFRMYQFQPANNQIQALTYSATKGTYMTSAAHQFILPYNGMRSPDFELIGTTTVTSGANASVTWSGLTGGAQYEWYAVARDASDVMIGTTQSFITGPMNSEPSAADDSYTVEEDHVLTVSAPGVLTNDSAPDGATLTASKVAGPSGGTLSLSSTGGFTYTPNANFAGIDTFTYKAYDGVSYSNTAAVSITVTPTNDAPTANKDYPDTLEDTPVTIPVLANDTDPDGDTLTVTSITTAAVYGTAVVQPDNTIVYTPNTKWYGSDSFRYGITDNRGGTSSARVYVTVTHVNHAPEANDGAVTTDEDKPVTVDLVASDYDSGDTLRYYIVAQPEHGTLSGTAPHLTYTPASNFNGSDMFTFRVKDSALYSNVAMISITVNPVSDAPTCAKLTTTINEDSAADISPNCSDADGDSITVSLASDPAHGQVAWVSGKFHYQPDADYNGTDTFTYKAADAALTSSAATVTVTIRAVNDAPVCQPVTQTIDEDATLLSEPACTDVDSASLTYSITSQPQHGTADISGGMLRYQPAPEYSGTDSFNYKAYDGALYSTSVPAAVTINLVIDPPQLASIAAQVVDEGSPVTFTAAVTAGDVPLANLTYQLSGNVPDGAQLSSTGAFTWTPTEAQGPGVFTFNVCVADGVNAPVCRPVSVTVKEVNQAPALGTVPALHARRAVLLTFTFQAVDPDLPANLLTFSLQGADVPDGVEFNPTTGVFTWTAAADAPTTTYAFEICVSDGTAKTCSPVSLSVVEPLFFPLVMTGG